MWTCLTQIYGDQINVVDALPKTMLKESFIMNVEN